MAAKKKIKVKSKPKKARKTKKTVEVKVKKKRPTSVKLGGPYKMAEFLRWAATWVVVKGLPGCVRMGKTSDGWYGVAIFYEGGERVEHVVYEKRSRQLAYIEALRTMRKAKA